MGLKLPAEHGAWGILAVPFVCAAVVSGTWNVPLALAGIAILALFLLRGSMEAHGSWKSLIVPAHLALATLAASAGGALVFFYQRLELLWLALAAAVLYVLQKFQVVRHAAHEMEKRSLPAEFTGVALLSLSAPAAWIAARGNLERAGVEVWLLNLLFFAGGILYVKYRVRGLLAHRPFQGWQERMGFAWPVFVYHLLLAVFLISWVVWAARPVVVLAAFAPGILRAWNLVFQLGQRFPIRRLGWTEVAHSLIFGALLIFSFRLAGL